jgi:hypothetical protein
MDVMVSVPTPTSVLGVTGATELVTTAGIYSCANVGAATPDYRCWGGGEAALGAGSGHIVENTPIAATALVGLGLTNLHGGGRVMYGIDSTGFVRCWGNPALQECGPLGATEVATPYQYTGLGSATAVVGGGFNFALAITGSGTLHCWGRNAEGECGLGILDSPINPPVTVPGITDATHVAAGDQHACVIRSGGGVWCTGKNERGELGRGYANRFVTENTMGRVLGLP